MAETTFMNNAVAQVFTSHSEKRVKQSGERKIVDHKANYEKAKEKLKNVITRDGGKFIWFDNENYGLLVAGVEHQNKLYFMLLDKDRKISFVPMKETYTWLKEVPNNLSVLLYLYQHERQTLRNKVEDWFANDESYVLLSDIGIRVSNNSGKKNGKNNHKNKKSNKKQTQE